MKFLIDFRRRRVLIKTSTKLKEVLNFLVRVAPVTLNVLTILAHLHSSLPQG